MNMQAIMMQAKKMQKDIENAQKELENSVYEGTSQLVSVKINGKHELISVKINSEEIDKDDIEMLEDMFLVAVNEANKNLEDDKQVKLGKYGKMLNGMM